MILKVGDILILKKNMSLGLLSNSKKGDKFEIVFIGRTNGIYVKSIDMDRIVFINKDIDIEHFITMEEFRENKLNDLGI